MNFKASMILGTLLLVGTSAFSQDAPKAEVAVDYSIGHLFPSSTANDFSLNGGDGSVAFFFSHYLGSKAKVEGYANATSKFTLPPGNPLAPAGGTLTGIGGLQRPSSLTGASISRAP
jgi:hypothetical protein